jgi:hypothetical protein
VADGFYVAGDSGIAALNADTRLAVRAASSIYRAIGTRIRKRGYRVLEERARVSAIGKLGLFTRAALAGMLSKDPAANADDLGDAALQALATARDLLLEHGVST